MEKDFMLHFIEKGKPATKLIRLPDAQKGDLISFYVGKKKHYTKITDRQICISMSGVFSHFNLYVQ